MEAAAAYRDVEEERGDEPRRARALGEETRRGEHEPARLPETVPGPPTAGEPAYSSPETASCDSSSARIADSMMGSRAPFITWSRLYAL
nr:hypothetical protein GCM10017583_34840 [Agromyces mediolanus]